MMNIILYGVPGSGKTSLARALSESLKLPHLEVDEVRKIGKQGKSPTTNPFFFLPTTEAYQAFGARTSENVIQGLLEVRKAYKDLVVQEINARKEGCIAEAAFLDPFSLKNNGLVILITVPDEEKHRQQFLEHRTKDAFTNGQFENARLIQDFLIKEANELNISTIENFLDLNFLIEKVNTLLSAS